MATLVGAGAADILTGTAGADSIDGGGGFDSLSGGAGDDTLQGGDGPDTLVGGPGADTLRGGAGVDLFLIGRGDSAPVEGQMDTIWDWDSGDLLALTGVGSKFPVSTHTLPTFAEALSFANGQIGAGGVDVVGVNVGADTYLFMDTAQNNGTADDAIRIVGTTASSVSARLVDPFTAGAHVNVTADLIQTAPLVTNGQAFTLHGAYPAAGPWLTINAPVIATSSTSGLSGVSDNNDGTVRGWLWVQSQGSLTVISTAANGTVDGLHGSSWSPHFQNDGLVEVTGRGMTFGVRTDSRDITFRNYGVFRVTSTESTAAGSTESRGLNAGHLEVRGHTAAYGFWDVDAVTNTGTILVFDENPAWESVAVALTDFSPELINSGFIQGEYALTASSSFGSIEVTNTGTMVGKVRLDDSTYFINSGTIRGEVTFSDRIDIYDGRLGVVEGAVRGGNGNDSLAGGASTDIFYGDLGLDTLDGGAGDDVLSGGRDDDLLIGGDGFDTASYADATMGVDLDLSTGRAFSSGLDTLSGFERALGGAFDDTLAGAAGEETLSGGAGADSIFGRAGADSIVGGGGGNFLRGDEGDDWIAGGDDTDDSHGNMGNDTLQGGAGDDWVVGGRDNDALYGETGHDVVWGNLGDDTCEGGDGADQVRGGQGDDLVRGDAGDDWISGDRGADTLTGGSGADIFHTFDGAGMDWVTDFNAAEGDRVYLLPGSRYFAYQFGGDTVVDVLDANNIATGRMMLVGVQLSSLPAGWIFGV